MLFICCNEVCVKNKILILLAFVSAFLLLPGNILAHPGRTDSNGCHYCRTNCAKWGLANNEYHCHNGSGTSSKKKTTSSSNISSKKKTSSTKTVVSKSSDNTLKSVSIDGENVNVDDDMTYSTKKEKVNIAVKLNSSKATYVINNNDDLKVGDNNIVIKVTAENGNVRSYSLLIKREKLSNNTNIKIIVDGNIINFISEKASINVSSDVNSLNYEYELEDKNSSLDVVGNDVLYVGNNKIVFVVTAEDETKKEYKLTVNKSSKSDETISKILGLAMLGGTGYGIYYLVNKPRRK